MAQDETVVMGGIENDGLVEEIGTDTAPDLESRLADAVDARLRTMAEFQNYRRRTDEERESLRGYLLSSVIESLLPIVDNLGRAVDAMVFTTDIDKIKDGILGVQRQLLTVLEKNGVEEIQASDAPFNPNLHNAVMRVDDSGVATDTIIEVLQPGYTLSGKVLRPALVKVAG